MKNSMKEREVHIYTELHLIVYLISRITIFGITLAFLIIGLISINNNEEYGFIVFFSIPLMLFFIISIFFGINPIFKSKIKRFEKEKNEEELIKLIKLGGEKGTAAFCSLYKMKSTKLKSVIVSQENRFQNIDERIFGFVTTLVINEELEEEKEKHFLTDSSDKLQITSVYFIGSKKELGNGMISKMPLTLDEDIVICPNCRNMAKKELLENWLKENRTCPICRKKLSINDFPIVDIRG